jgi:hypothetical protein
MKQAPVWDYFYARSWLSGIRAGSLQKANPGKGVYSASLF